MKPCARCKEVKPLDAFARRRGDGRQSYCQACIRTYQRGRPRTLLARRLVRAAKTNRCCSDCGLPYPHYYVLDFDHRPGAGKRANINVLVKQGASEKVLREEMAKCDLVCANCHRIRTWQRKVAAGHNDKPVLL